MPHDLGIIGTGNMAAAVAAGLLRGKVMGPGQMIGSSPTVERRAAFTEKFGVETVADNRVVAGGCRTLLLAVKPQKAPAVLAEIAGSVGPDTLVVSLMAAVTSASINSRLGGNRRIVRTMPNTPMRVGHGVIAIAPNDLATAADLATARALFACAGTVVEVREDQIDAVIAVSGSGPAYFFYLVEQMTAAGVSLGLSAEQANLLAAKTCLGAGVMLTELPQSPAELRAQVTSPGGTTAAAIGMMESRGLGETVKAAMTAAVERSRQLSAGTSAK